MLGSNIPYIMEPLFFIHRERPIRRPNITSGLIPLTGGQRTGSAHILQIENAPALSFSLLGHTSWYKIIGGFPVRSRRAGMSSSGPFSGWNRAVSTPAFQTSSRSGNVGSVHVLPKPATAGAMSGGRSKAYSHPAFPGCISQEADLVSLHSWWVGWALGNHSPFSSLHRPFIAFCCMKILINIYISRRFLLTRPTYMVGAAKRLRSCSSAENHNPRSVYAAARSASAPSFKAGRAAPRIWSADQRGWPEAAPCFTLRPSGRVRSFIIATPS